MKIIELTEKRCVIQDPDIAHKVQAGILMVIGVIGSFSVLVSREQYGIIIIFLILITAGILMLRFGGKPDFLVLDKGTDKLEVFVSPGAFSKAKPDIFKLSDIVSSALDSSGVFSRRTYGIIFTLTDGTQISGTAYNNRYKHTLGIFNQVQGFLGR